MRFFQKRKATLSAPNSPEQDDNEKGSMTIFGLGMSVGIVAAGGVALDAMYFESKRSAAQDALDRCSVMAALAQNRIDGGATSSRTAQQVAQDCMAKSDVGTTGLTTSITSDEDGRNATLSGNYAFASLRQGSTASENFVATSTAAQKMPNLELTVAIDLTNAGSLALMKQPLITFLRTVTAPDTARKVTINVVPFGKNVVLNPSLMARFNTELRPAISNIENRSCILLPEESKNKIAIDVAATYRWSWPLEMDTQNRTGTFDSWHYYYASMPSLYAAANPTGVGLGQIDRLANPTYMAANSSAVIHSNCNVTSVNNSPLFGGHIPRTGDTGGGASVIDKVNSLTAVVRGGATAAGTVIRDANAAEGLKWALASMDPSLRSIFSAQIGAGLSRPEAAGRPFAYDAEDTQKVLLFVPNSVFNMFDGTFTQTSGTPTNIPSRAREIKTEYLNGSLPDPDIWRVAIPGHDNLGYRYSIYHANAPGPNKYWVTAGTYGATDGTWEAAPFQYSAAAPAERQSWRQVFERMTVDYLIRALHMIPMKNIGVLPTNSAYHYQTLADRFTYIETDGTKVINYFDSLCAEAKSKGVIIYTLLGNGTANISNDTFFNAKATTARNKYAACATSPAHNFSAGTTAQINSALRLISSNIAQLSLAQ